MTPTITIDTLVTAPLDRVWTCYTDPDHITRWNFANDDWCCPSAENDLRVGGTYKARMEAKDGSFGFDFEVFEFLKGLAMPAVLLEVGFLTNSQEAAVLSDPSYPEALAGSIAAAVERFCEQFEAEGHSAGAAGAADADGLRTGARR